MIIEDERRKVLDSTHYKLMGCPVHIRGYIEWHILFIYTMPFGTMKCMMIFKNNLTKEWWRWNGQQITEEET
jgi:hypothetical protein